jgi:sulfur-carrier protein
MTLVRVRGLLKQLADNHSEHQLEGQTVQQLLHELERRHPALAGWVLDERGALRRHINVYVNGERGEPETGVRAEDKVDVLPAISGGAA